MEHSKGPETVNRLRFVTRALFAGIIASGCMLASRPAQAMYSGGCTGAYLNPSSVSCEFVEGTGPAVARYANKTLFDSGQYGYGPTRDAGTGLDSQATAAGYAAAYYAQCFENATFTGEIDLGITAYCR
jgi:hypothetical protein